MLVVFTAAAAAAAGLDLVLVSSSWTTCCRRSTATAWMVTVQLHEILEALKIDNSSTGCYMCA